MSIRAFCNMERFDEGWFWESDAEKLIFLEVKENLSAFIETKKEELNLGIFGEQLLEPIIAEHALVLIGKQKKVGYLIGDIEDFMESCWYDETIKEIVNFIDDLEELEIYKKVAIGYPCIYVSDTNANTISYKAASNIAYHIIEAKYFRMQFQLWPIMEEYKSLIN